MKIDAGLLPVKAHFFFFFAVSVKPCGVSMTGGINNAALFIGLYCPLWSWAGWRLLTTVIYVVTTGTDGLKCSPRHGAALGPILPQLNVFGRQLGASPAAMGLVTAVLPLLWALAKPGFGYLVDYFTNLRKLIFMALIVIMTGSYCGLWFLPTPIDHDLENIIENVYRMNETVHLKKYNATDNIELGTILKKYNCQWNCLNRTEISLWLGNTTYVNTIYIEDDVNIGICDKYNMNFEDLVYGEVRCSPKDLCDLNCIDHRHGSYTDNGENDTNLILKEAKTEASNILNYSKNEGFHLSTAARNRTDEDHRQDSSFYISATFWVFVVLMCVGTVAFNVANCIGDAVCFDVLGPDRGNKYGSQRAWGTAGYGGTALLGGWLVDSYSPGYVKDFTPAFVLAMAFTIFDLISCRKLTLPPLSSPSDSGRALRELLKMPRVLVFLVFAVIAGAFDSFIIYYMFWYLEELAEVSGRVGQIKLIEGVIVAAQSFIGELLFFYLSGRIIKRWGHGVTMTVSLLCYSIRLALISLLTDPWILVFTEAIMQGPTYALMYATIVGYAAHVAPEGYSATVQGIVAGMDDGLGFALGSLVGGQLYAWAGGAGSFRIMSAVGLLAAVAHGLLGGVVRGGGGAKADAERVKASKPCADVTSQEEQEKMLYQEDTSNVIYRDTVVAIDGKSRTIDRL